MITPALQPYMNTREDSAFRFLGVPTLMRSTSETTNGAFGLMEHWTIPPGFASPYHVHHLEDEAFYVQMASSDSPRPFTRKASFVTVADMKTLCFAVVYEPKCSSGGRCGST